MHPTSSSLKVDAADPCWIDSATCDAPVHARATRFRANADSFASPLLQARQKEKRPLSRSLFLLQTYLVVGLHLNQRPSGYEADAGGSQRSSTESNRAESFDPTRSLIPNEVQRSQPSPTVLLHPCYTGLDQLERPADDPLLTVKQVAERLQLSTATVYKICHAGLLPFTRIGPATLRIAASDVNAFVAKLKVIVPSPEKSGR
jgi:excisionase family DNA binding protein